MQNDHRVQWIKPILSLMLLSRNKIYNVTMLQSTVPFVQTLFFFTLSHRVLPSSSTSAARSSSLIGHWAVLLPSTWTLTWFGAAYLFLRDQPRGKINHLHDTENTSYLA